MAGDFTTVYVVEGDISVKNLPEHIFGSKIKRYAKGLRLEVPAQAGVYPVEFAPTIDVELFGVHIGCSGYSDKDYWELIIGEEPEPTLETIYTKELHEEHGLAVTVVPANTRILINFHNISETSKIVYFDLIMKK